MQAQSRHGSRIRRATLTVAILCAAALAAPVASQATVRYAAPSLGMNSGSCATRDTACNIWRAVEAVPQQGDEVVLAPGAYEIGSQTLSIPPGVNVHGEHPGALSTHIVSMSNGYAVNLLNDGARLADVRVTNDDGNFGAVNLSSASVVDRVRAEGEATNAVGCQMWKGVIRDSICWSSGTGGYGLGTSLAGPAGTHGLTITNVTAVGTGSNSAGVSFNAAGPGVGLDVQLRNVIADGTGSDVRAFTTNGGTGTNLSFASSNFTTVGTDGGPGSTPGTVTSNGAQGNLAVSPQFVNAAGGDFHQKPASLTIDRGSVDGNVGSADIDGQTRTSGEEVDMGADEFIDTDLRFADTNGDGPEPCLEADPCPITRAVGGNAAEGDEVLLAEGVYDVGSSPVELTKGVNVHPAAGGDVLIRSSRAYAVSVHAAGARLAGVSIETSSGSALFLGTGLAEGVQAHSSSNGAPACAVFNGTIRDSVCWSDAPLNGFGAGVNVSGGAYAPVFRNVTAVATGTGSYGLRYDGSSTSIAVNARNVIASGVVADVRAAASSGSVTLEVDHSNYATSQTVGGAAVPDPGTLTNQTDEPVFADASAGDFHQLAASPTVNAGAVDALLGAADIDGEARSQGSAPDIGADERTYVAPPPPPDTMPDHGTAGQGAKAKKCKKAKKRKAGGKRPKCKRKGGSKKRR